ncbi:DUF4249 family protein [Namhaeicola litoreus]|uniref:DUF4249 family protein n=1 Tax=Namhaeicola litoreus TaxID=1052145 RepID=A0ABW3XZI3_9FLAO
MKPLSYIKILAISLFLISCEDVIDVDLNTAPPKLVVEASIEWLRGTSGSNQVIRLSTTTDYYATDIPPVTGATVSIENSKNEVFDFQENGSTGEYICNNFVPELFETYTLFIEYNGESFTAEETLLPVPEITRVEQVNDGGFSGEDIEVKFFFDDFKDVSNFYLSSVQSPYVVFPEYSVSSDEFFENNEMFSLYFSEDIEAGDKLDFVLGGISETYFNYMNILLSQGGDSGGGPFQTPSSTVRGNIINQSNFDNFALGFFRLSETDEEVYIVQ